MSTLPLRPPPRRFGSLGLAIGSPPASCAACCSSPRSAGARPVIESRTVTVPAATGAGGTVVVSTRVPPLTGQRLDVALDRLERARFTARVEGGGLFGVEANWRVVAQSPTGGIMLEQGSQVVLRVARN